MIQVLVFEGGEHVDDNNATTITSWCHDELVRVIREAFGKEWGHDRCWWHDDAIRLIDTLEIFNTNFAQAAKCGVNGGQIYVVRSS